MQPQPSSAPMNHPAAEIVAIALRKICRLVPKKSIELLEAAKAFLDNTHTIIPANGSPGQLPTAPGSSSQQPPEASPAISRTPSAAATAPAAAPPAGPPGVAEQASAGDAATDTLAVPDGLGGAVTASFIDPTHAASDIRAHFEAEAAAGDAVSTPELAARVDSTDAGGGDAAAAAPAADVSATAAAAVSGGAEAVLTAAAAAPRPAPPAVPPPPPDLVPRTERALSDATCLYLLRLLTLAVDTQKAPAVEVVLDCLQKLIAFGFLQGSCYAISISEAALGAVDAAGSEPSGPDVWTETPQAQAVSLMCRCDEIPDEGVELQILKGLLTATTSTTFTVHGQALLLAVRTCYNIFLMSRSEVNQTTAKASLTQMLNVVFQRMEARSVLVDIRPVAVADVMLAGHRPSSALHLDQSVSAGVQAFLNSVVMVPQAGGGAGAGAQTPSDIRSSVAGAFDGKPPAARRDGDSDDEREHFSLGGAAHIPAHSNASSSSNLATAAASATAAKDVSFSSPPLESVGVGAVLQRDAFLVFRALCKLSIRTSDTATLADVTAVRGKLLALELLKVVLDNGGPELRGGQPGFTSAIRQYLCLALLKNSASSLPAALHLSGAIFLSLLLYFRTALKAEIGVFFPMILLKPFEHVASGPMSGTPGAAAAAAAAPGVSAVSSLGHKAATLRLVSRVCGDGQLLVDLFVNYDCDLESTNMFERLVNGLVKLAQQPVQVPAGMGLSSMSETHSTWLQETALRGEALQALVILVDTMWAWYKAASGLDVTGSDDAASVAGSALANGDDEQQRSFTGQHRRSESAASVTPTIMDSAHDVRAGAPPRPRVTSGGKSDAALLAALSTGGAGEDGAVVAGGNAASGSEGLGARRAYKIKFRESVTLFNKKPKKGIEALQKENMLGRSPEEVARFLANTDQGLDKVIIGDYLGEREDFNLKVMHAYVDDMDFTGMEFDAAIRKFLSGFRLPGEAQKIDRLMEKFAERYCVCIPGGFKSADVAYVLAYSVIMLNTDAHNPQVKVKMSREGFLKNNRGINDGADLDPEFMSALYDRIVNNEIKLKDAAAAAGSGAAVSGNSYSYNLMMQTVLSLVGGTRKEVSNEPSDESVRRTLDDLHRRAKSATLVTATEGDAVCPMMELVWAPLLGVLSVLFDEYTDPRLVTLCLQGFNASCCLTAQVGMPHLRDIFINSLCNFTHLHSPATMKYKNALAFKCMLQVAHAVGDNLGDRWVDVLRCISRWELLQQIASGTPGDAALFSPGVAVGADGSAARLKLGGAPAAKKLGASNGPEEPKSMDSLAMNEPPAQRVHARGYGGKGEGSLHAEVLNSVDSQDLNRLFQDSGRLDSEAIVAFVRAMTAVSLDELRDATAPRVFSLTKIIEIAHVNMTRIRLVWTRIWTVLSQYFIQVGCHSNLSVAMYAVDSLRQLAMKFLERDELANYTFQNDFLRPFVVVMRQSQAVEIRELILRCLSQMVLARVSNVKSGWRSMFMVFTTAAGDRDPTIVRLAFTTIEKIVREHFDHITETETTTFTDCVNCLIAFTNNPHSLDVALNSIAFLRYCSAKLAEGAIAEAEPLPEASVSDTYQAQRILPGEHSNGADARGPGGPSGDPSSSGASAAAPMEAAPAGRPVKFVDRDEHVYFWFPLLAGLSELTFDPRPEIRHAALEVLFDTLRHHGGTFAGSFWRRIFDSVLLPIFDHVRAEVTDTTTFTSEKKRQTEEAWLYETCTQCLQHLVDLFAQFHAESACLLTRLLDLLRGLVKRSHQPLAAVGVAAFVRLVTQAGGFLTDVEWDEVLHCLTALVADTLPNAADLVAPPHLRPHPPSENGAAGESSRGGSGGGTTSGSGDADAAAAVAAAAALGAAGSSLAARAYTLREGVGARRLVRFRCQASVQLLLVQGCSEMYVRLACPARAQGVLLDTLQAMADHARRTDSDLTLRRQLALQQALDHVPEDKLVADPPLLRLEAEAAHAYLSLLMHVRLGQQPGAGAAPTSNGASSHAAAGLALQQPPRRLPPAAGTAEGVKQRLMRLCSLTLARFAMGGASDGGAHTLAAWAQGSAAPGSHHDASSLGPSPASVAAGPGGTAAGQRPSSFELPASDARHFGSRGGRTGSALVAGRTSNGWAVLLAPPETEYAAFGPLVTSVLGALAVLDDAAFNAHLPELFPLLTRLIGAEYAPPEVLRGLALLFSERISPLLGVPAA